MYIILLQADGRVFKCQTLACSHDVFLKFFFFAQLIVNVCYNIGFVYYIIIIIILARFEI